MTDPTPRSTLRPEPRRAGLRRFRRGRVPGRGRRPARNASAGLYGLLRFSYRVIRRLPISRLLELPDVAVYC